LGLGSSATLDTGVANGQVIVADATGLPVIDGSQLTNVSATDSTKLAIANNLSDLNSASTARTNLGLGTSATLDTGVANGQVIVADATGLPVIDGSQLTNVSASAPDVVTDSSGTDTTISTYTGTEEIHLISNSTNNVTITIPAASTVGEGYKYQIKRLGTGTVSVTPSSGNIDASTSFSIASQYDSVTLVSDNSNYYII
jgi:hypothetical protein